jgi:hypothetical protein
VAPIRVDGRMSDAALQQYLDRIVQEGLIRVSLQPSDVADFSFVERAARGG